ncbi:hypothetical protein GCM10011414_10470 [Croceivirga lutea]|nr:hypothetical protein [Croceivirga lutea]GGG42766.1 hypothetical protein GCM10011414_10470 [Croceivirga lutea]
MKLFDRLRDTYQNDFKFLVYGELPDEESVLTSILKISTQLAALKWTIVS